MTSVYPYYLSIWQTIPKHRGKHFIIFHDFVGQEFWQGSTGLFFCSMWSSWVTHWFLNAWSHLDDLRQLHPHAWQIGEDDCKLGQPGFSLSPCSHKVSPHGPGLPETKARPGTDRLSPHCSEQPWVDFKGRRNKSHFLMGEMSKNLWPCFIHHNLKARFLLPESLI